MTDNVIYLNFGRPRAEARHTGPTPIDPLHIVAVRTAELTRLFKHRYPDHDLSSDDALIIASIIFDHFANVQDGKAHILDWMNKYAPDHASEKVAAEWRSGVYWYKAPLGKIIGLTTAEAEACFITTIEAKGRRRGRRPAPPSSSPDHDMAS